MDTPAIDTFRTTARNILALSLVRRHNAGELDLYKIESFTELKVWIDQIGQAENDAIEVYKESLELKFSSMKLCEKNGDTESVLIILGTLIESEIRAP